MLRALIGGAIIGLAASALWFANRRVAGVSGVLRQVLVARGDRVVPLAFIAGLIAAGLAGGGSTPVLGGPALVVAGLLVGVGTTVSNGCTSGHGVCGLSRGSRRALVATLIFMATGILTVAVVGW